MRLFAILAGVCALVLGSAPRALAEPLSAAGAEAVIDGGLSFFQAATTGGTLAQTGYFLHFQVESRENWIRPNFGGLLELNSGTNRLIDGHMMAGLELVAYKASYFKPFLGGYGDFGWANLSTSTNTFNGNVYGFELSAGTEIRFSDHNSAIGLRLTTTFRYLIGAIGGGIQGSDLNTVAISLGVTF